MRHLLLACLLLTSLSAHADTLAEARKLFEAFSPAALPALQSILKTEPRNVEAWRMLGISQLRQGEPAAAVESLEKAVKLEPERAELHHLLGQAYGSNINNVGTLSKLSYAGKIRRAFETAVELNPDYIDARTGVMQYYLQAPGMAGGSVDKAREQAAAIARLHPGRGHLARGMLLNHEGKKDEAIKAYRKAVEVAPEYAPARLSLGLALHQMEKLEEAFEVFQTMQQELPDAGQGWYQFGRLALLSGERMEEGEAALRHYLSLPRREGMPEPKFAHLRLGQLLAKRGDRDGARSEIGKAIQLDPRFEEAKKALKEL